MATVIPRSRGGLRGLLAAVASAPLLAVLAAQAAAQALIPADDPSWRLQSSSNGIALYRTSIRDSRAVPVKATITIPGTIEEVSLVLEDLPRRPQWIGNRTESVLLERAGDYQQIEYVRVDLPWPAANRSALFRARIIVSDGGQRATVAVESVDSHPADKLPRLVRSHVYPSTFEMTQKPGRVEVVALVFIDPRGRIPKWIVNYFAGRVARATLAGLRQQVARKLYSPAQRNAMRRRIHDYRALHEGAATDSLDRTGGHAVPGAASNRSQHVP